MQKKRFVDRKLKAYILYNETPLFKAVLLVAIPGLIIALIWGLYIFVDQLMLATLVPNDGVHTFEKIFPGIDQEQVKNILIKIKEASNGDLDYSFQDVSSVIKSSITISTPQVNILNMLPTIMATGGSTVYARLLALNDKQRAKQVWKTTFYATLITGVLACIIFISINEALLRSVATPIDTKRFARYLNEQETTTITNYFNIVRERQIQWAHQFIEMLSICTITSSIISLISYLVRAEGRLKIVTLIEVFCIGLLFILDYIFITQFKLGVKGIGFATLVGGFFDFSIYFSYLVYLNKKKQTWISFKDLNPVGSIKLSYLLLIPALIIGLSVFLRGASNAVANYFFLLVQAVVCDKNGFNAQEMQSYGGIAFSISSLFYATFFGMADGIRVLASYNYQKSRFDSIKKIYWYALIVCFIYAATTYISTITFLSDGIINLFNVDEMSRAKAYRYITINNTVSLALVISIGGLLVFQATNRLFISTILSVYQAIVVFPIVLLITYHASIAVGGESGAFLYIATTPLAMFGGALSIFILSTYYLYKHLGFVKYKTIKGKYKVYYYKPKRSFIERQV